MNLNKIAKSVALASALFASGAAMAANQGSLGATSEGDLDVTLSIADRVQITGLDDIALGAYSGTGTLVGSSAFCVYRNGTGLYDLTVTSGNEDAGSFQATDGTDFIVYTVKIDDDADASDGTATDSSATQTGLAGNGTAADCGGGNNAALEVTFAQSALQAAPTGSFTDTVTLLVEPN